MPVTDVVNEAEAARLRWPASRYGDFRPTGVSRGQSEGSRDKRSDGCRSRASGRPIVCQRRFLPQFAGAAPHRRAERTRATTTRRRCRSV
jgi:hypothetical protein